MKSLELTQEKFVICGANIASTQNLSRKSESYLVDSFRRLKANKVALFSATIIVIMFLFAIFGELIQPYTYDGQDVYAINQKPSFEHFFGTDDLGRDIFVRASFGVKVSLSIALISTIINFFVGSMYGGIAGYKGGIIDTLLMRVVEIISSVPAILWIILLMVVMGPGYSTMIISFAITGWGGMARLVRGQVLQLREMDYVHASKMMRANTFWIVRKHLIPNCLGPMIVSLTFSIPGAIFAEAFLSFIGLGLPLPLASLGTLCNTGYKLLMIYPYQLLYPALLISMIMLGFSLLGDALRDALDPKLRK